MRKRARPRRLRTMEVDIEITQEMIDRASREGLSGAQLVCLAIQAAIPGAAEIEVNGQNLWSPGQPS